MTARVWIATAFATALALSLLYVRSRYLVVELSYRVADQQALKRKLEQDKRALGLELATLKRPERIERIVRGAMGMTRESSNVVVVDLRAEQRR